LTLPDISKMHLICQSLYRTVSHNSVWAEITIATFPESQPSAAAGINWKHRYLVCHSKKFPHLVLRHGGLVSHTPGPGPGKFYLLSVIFMGDETEMGHAESFLFLKKIAHGATMTKAAPKGGAMSMTYGYYHLLAFSMSQMPKSMFWERSAAIIVTCLHRTNHNTNMDTLFNKKCLAELNSVLQQAAPETPLIVFFHYSNPINNTNSNSVVDSVFVKKLNDIMSELIIRSTFPLRRLLVQPYNNMSNFGISDGLWWTVGNTANLPMSIEQLQLTWHAPSSISFTS